MICDRRPNGWTIEVDELKGCTHPEWNVQTEVSQITDPPIAAGHFLVKFVVSCSYCGLTLHSIEDGKVLPYLETVMFRFGYSPRMNAYPTDRTSPVPTQKHSPPPKSLK